MRVLISNDDGIRAEGLRILAQELSRVAEIYVAAPLNEKSGTSHGLTTTTPLRVYDHQMDDLTPYAWAVDGTPADCVKLAVDALLPAPPDLVLSGINHGPNLGTDIIYSGTVAAAMEGYLNGFSAIALSVAGVRKGKGTGNYLYTAQLAAQLCQRLVAEKPQQRIFFNVNVPGSCHDDVKSSPILTWDGAGIMSRSANGSIPMAVIITGFRDKSTIVIADKAVMWRHAITVLSLLRRSMPILLIMLCCAVCRTASFVAAA